MNKKNSIRLENGVTLLKRLHIRPCDIMVTGSVALDIHGILPKWRKCHDLDFIVKVSDEDWGCMRLLEMIAGTGKHGSVYGEYGKKSDFITFKTKDGIIINVWKYNDSGEWSDLTDVHTGVRVAEVNHIISVKKKYARKKDYDDIIGIIDNIISIQQNNLTNMDKKRMDFVEDYINSHFKTFMSDADADEVTQAILMSIVRDMDDNSESGINCDDIDAALTRMIKSKFCK